MVKLRNVYIMVGSMGKFLELNKTHVLQQTLGVMLCLKKDDKDITKMMWFEEGFACDGLSVPKAFRWFLPSWDKRNGYYNLAGVVHDALYGNSGFGTFTREECDNIFRGLLRESGISRFKAGMADKCVELFARKHFGSDNLNVAKLVSLRDM